MKALHFYVSTFEKGDSHMNVAFENRSLYEEFELEKDILYFRTGHHELVSFHGINFNVRRRITKEQLPKTIAEGAFFKVNHDCFVNIKKINTIKDGHVYFESHDADSKCVPISKLKLHRLKELMLQLQLDRN
jgi:DNA-binding LytR/AlgR family response regulator